MIKWPERAKAAIRKLFEPLQDIDVYVEDTNDEAFYKTLLNAVSDGKIKVARVFALGGKTKVVDAAQHHDQGSRRALFVVDGDFDWVLGVPAPNIVGLHQHNAYCIENLLVCERALCTILSQEAVVTAEEAIRLLNFRGWIRSVQEPLLELFAAFATAKELAAEHKTVAQGSGSVCTRQPGGCTVLDRKKVKRAISDALAASEAEAGEHRTISTYRQTLLRLKALPFPLHAVSGKDFLLPLLDFWLQSHGCKVKRKSLRMRLATSGDMRRFRALHEAIHNAARGY